MEKKKIYLINLGYVNYLATYDRNQAVTLLNALEGMKKLMSFGSIYSEEEKFCWLEDLRIELISVLLDIYPNKEEAKRCMENYEKAKKMGLISKKKEDYEREKIN